MNSLNGERLLGGLDALLGERLGRLAEVGHDGLRELHRADDAVALDRRADVAGVDAGLERREPRVVHALRYVALADRYNEPGVLTTFAAYEYSPVLPDTGKHHRNVLFNGSELPAHAISSLDGPV